MLLLTKEQCLKSRTCVLSESWPLGFNVLLAGTIS